MKNKVGFYVLVATVWALVTGLAFTARPPETKADHDARMAWWREARFGLFIHWGLYAVPAGEWKGKTDYGEWIRTSAQIPLAEYDQFRAQFNPGHFDAAEWARLAKQAGMKYIVITSKHHDGFCLFDTAQTDFNVMNTPFKRDVMKELSSACRQEGLKMCWYHSIMDWHHPDYLPRRDWEKDRPVEGADFGRFVQYLKTELKELLTNYGDIGVIWFDGEWEPTWNSAYGRELYDYVRGLQPGIIVNNRVGAGRSGMEGFTKPGEYGGDFGTPEQQIPSTGAPGVDWETCLTMNDHWGYNKNDQHWKSAQELIRMLADIASKGGNFLLNVGPTADGVFPSASVERLQAMGQWMKVNGEAIYGTQASPFPSLSWGRCTQKAIEGGTRLYLHVFDWPTGGQLLVPGIFNQAKQAFLLSEAQRTALAVSRRGETLLVTVPPKAPDADDSVVVLDVEGKPDINIPPKIEGDCPVFVNTLDVPVTTSQENVEIRYTLDGHAPTADSPLVQGKIRLTGTSTVTARSFRQGRPVSGFAQATFTKVNPKSAVKGVEVTSGLIYAYYEGDWDKLPDFGSLQPAAIGVVPAFDLSPRKQPDHCGFMYSGFIKVPASGVYTFFTDSDDGSRLYIGDKLVVENDGLHGLKEAKACIALSAGLHSIRVCYFNKTGSGELTVSCQGATFEKQPIPADWLFHQVIGTVKKP